jgi:hypothetical protein
MAEDARTAVADRITAELGKVADQLRARVDLFGKTLAAVATLGTTAVGLSKIGDLFPATGNLLWVFLACAALAVAALAAIWVAVELMRVGRPVFMRADLESNEELDADEKKAVRPVFEAAAKRFGYTSLLGLQEREQSLRSAATRVSDENERTRWTGLADDVKAEIDQAMARAQVVVIRRRATEAVSAPIAWGRYAAVIVGLVLFAVGTDKVSSDRTDHVAEAKACGEARKAGATAAELGRAKPACDSEAAQVDEAPPPPSAAEARARVTSKLAAALDACTELVEKEGVAESGPLKTEECDPVREAVSGMNQIGTTAP